MMEYQGMRARLLGRSVRFIRTSELIQWAKEWKNELGDYDVIIGIPRSGLIPAMAMADESCPFTTPELLAQGKAFKPDPGLLDKISKAIANGISDAALEEMIIQDGIALHIEPHRAFMVDDTMNTGDSMSSAKAMLPSGLKVDCGAVIASKEFTGNGHRYHKLLSRDRYGEWNLSVANLGKVVSDMDGVFCENPPPSGYEEWIKDPTPNFLPIHDIDIIVTARQERYREITERWLRGHNVRFGVLKMELDVDGRIDLINSLPSPPDMILESDHGHALKLWKFTGVPTLCFDTMTMFSHGWERAE